MLYSTEIYKALIFLYASSNTQMIVCVMYSVAMFVLHILVQVIDGWEVYDLLVTKGGNV